MAAGNPGFRTTRSATHNLVVIGDSLQCPSGAIISGDYTRDVNNTEQETLRAGLPLVWDTTNDVFRTFIIGKTTAAYTGESSEVTELTVSSTVAAEIVRNIGSSGTFYLRGPASASGTMQSVEVTYSAVNTTTGAITITDVDYDFIAGSIITPAFTGVTLLMQPWGVRVVDSSYENVDTQLGNVLISGLVDTNNIIDYPSDSSIKSYLKGLIQAVTPGVAFNDDIWPV